MQLQGMGSPRLRRLLQLQLPMAPPLQASSTAWPATCILFLSETVSSLHRRTITLAIIGYITSRSIPICHCGSLFFLNLPVKLPPKVRQKYHLYTGWRKYSITCKRFSPTHLIYKDFKISLVRSYWQCLK